MARNGCRCGGSGSKKTTFSTGSYKDLFTAARLGEIDALSSDEYVPPITNFNQYRTPLGARYYALFVNLNGRASDLTNKELRQDMANSVPKEKIIETNLWYFTSTPKKR